jgi:hypothetical protein
MKTILLLLLILSPVQADEANLTPKEREASADCIVEGIIQKTAYTAKMEYDDLWVAKILITKSIKGDLKQSKSVSFYFDQAREIKTKDGFTFSGRVCPAYVALADGLKGRFYLVRGNIGTKRDVLILNTEQWLDRQ